MFIHIVAFLMILNICSLARKNTIRYFRKLNKTFRCKGMKTMTKSRSHRPKKGFRGINIEKQLCEVQSGFPIYKILYIFYKKIFAYLLTRLWVSDTADFYALYILRLFKSCIKCVCREMNRLTLPPLIIKTVSHKTTKFFGHVQNYIFKHL